MTYPEVQFVSAPEAGATVLFDFNELTAPSAVKDGSFSIGSPSVEGDPDGLSVQYGPREVSFTLWIYGTRAAALAAQALLARTFMLRRRGWLRVRLDATVAPVWLRTYTPTPGELDFSLIRPTSAADAWQIEVSVPAEPFVRGERITLGTYTINNNPAAGTNPLGVTLPAVIGDAPAPLRIVATFSRTHNQSDVLISSSVVPAGYTPTTWQVGGTDGWSVGSDTSASVVDANFSGGSYRRVTFATTSVLATRIAGPAPASIAPGTYRVLLRMARDSTASTFSMRLGYRTLYSGDVFDGSPLAVMDRVASTGSVHATYADLGVFEFPNPRSGVDFPEVAEIPNIALQVSRLSGAANFIADTFVLIPVDLAGVTTLQPWEKSSTLISEFPGQGPQTAEATMWDGDAEVVARVTAAGGLDASVPAICRGQFPSIYPGLSNRLTLIQQTRLSSGNFGVVDNSDSIADTATVVVSYQPRHLYLGAS